MVNPAPQPDLIQSTIATPPTARQPFRSNVVIEVDSEKFQIWPNWIELWEFRLVLISLVRRDFKVRFTQTVLGVGWAVIQPISTMIVFTIFFNGVAGITTPNGIPYPLFSFAALVPWTFFANGVTLSAESVIGQGNLVRKVYVPRMIIPISRILGGAIDFGISMSVFFVLMLIYRQSVPLSALVFVPLVTLLVVCLTTGLGLWASALMVYFRDVRFLIPYGIQILLFASPIAYSSLRLPEDFRILYALNPMVSVIEGMRFALLGISALPPAAYLVSVLVTFVILLTGIVFFRRAEGRFADVI